MAEGLNFDISLEDNRPDKGLGSEKDKFKIKSRKDRKFDAQNDQIVMNGGSDVPVLGAQNQHIPSAGIFSCLSMAYWQPYFLINTPTLRDRLLFSLNPRKTSDFLSSVQNQPDLYGPIWLGSFLVFVIIICSSLSFVMKRIFLNASKIESNYNYQNIGYVFCIVYGFLFGFGAIATIVLKFIGNELGFVKVDTS